MHESARRVAVEHLQSVAADRIEAVAPDLQSLRTAPAQAGRNDLELVENAVAIGIFQPADRIAVADQQAPVAIEREVIAAASQFGAGRAVHMIAGREFKTIIEQNRAVGWRVGSLNTDASDDRKCQMSNEQCAMRNRC